jgi:hypothetical protein
VHPADAVLGLEENYTVGFRSLAIRAGSANAFEVAKENLKAYCGLETSHMTIRKLCHEEAAKVAKWVDESSEVPKNFIETSGNVEVTIDAAKVNTTGGWRDIKIAIFSKRLFGESVLPAQWDTRKLPDVLVRVAFASVEEKSIFQNRLNHYRCLLRVGSTGDISALGDGAEWIWNIIRDVFGDIRECLDVFHALGHLSDSGKALYKEGTLEYDQWQEATKWELLESGFERIEKRLDELEKGELGKDERESLRKLRGYLENHKTRLGYRERLAEGRAIGSGQVEGACKNMIGKRLKQTGAKWKLERLNEMAVLCAVHYSKLWEMYWIQAN